MLVDLLLGSGNDGVADGGFGSALLNTQSTKAERIEISSQTPGRRDEACSEPRGSARRLFVQDLGLDRFVKSVDGKIRLKRTKSNVLVDRRGLGKSNGDPDERKLLLTIIGGTKVQQRKVNAEGDVGKANEGRHKALSTSVYVVPVALFSPSSPGGVALK